MRTIIVVIYVFLFLILGLPVLGIEWIIAKFDKHAADISQLRIVQWGLRCAKLRMSRISPLSRSASFSKCFMLQALLSVSSVPRPAPHR